MILVKHLVLHNIMKAAAQLDAQQIASYPGSSCSSYQHVRKSLGTRLHNKFYDVFHLQ